jgi:hypothetical protein
MDQDCPICNGEGWRCEEQSCRTDKLASSAEIRIACPRYHFQKPRPSAGVSVSAQSRYVFASRGRRRRATLCVMDDLTPDCTELTAYSWRGCLIDEVES